MLLEHDIMSSSGRLDKILSMRKHGIVIYSVHKIFNPSTEHRPASSLNVNTVDYTYKSNDSCDGLNCGKRA
jgi:hypothetical protein